MDTSDLIRLVIAGLGGAAIGLERQWSGHAEGPGARFAGIRTFTFLGAIGGFTGWLWSAGITLPAAILLSGAVAIVAAGDGTELPPRNPLQLKAALQMAVLFQGVLMAVHAIREFWGASGVLTSAAVLGLTDVDALTVSMARDVAETISPAVAATAIAIGVLVNTVMKLGLALVFGSRRFKTIAGAALAVMLVTLAIGLVYSL